MDWPKISIITPTLNQGKFIQQTINSVLNQNYPNLEYIVMDGGSSDETLGILRSYGKRLKWISQRDNGQADAINTGMELASGEILAFINFDDYYLPGVFEMVARTFTRTNCKWLTGDYRIVDENDIDIQPLTIFYKRFWRNFSSPNLLFILNYIVQPSTFWTRDLWNNIGLFDVSLQYALDYDLWNRAIKISRPYIIKQPLSAFRIHGSSKGGSMFQNQFDEELQVLKRYNRNPFILRAHQFHNFLIKSIYKIIK